MAQLHPTTDTDFQERQYGFQLPGTPNPNQTDRQGVRQVTVDRQPRITDRRRTTVRQRAFAPGTAEPARRLRTRTAKRASLVRYTPSEQPTPKSTARTNNQKRHIDPAVHVAARARAFTVSLIIFSWTATLYLFVQLPLAVFSLLMMGASVSVEGSWVATAVEFVWDTVGYILGLPTIDISSLFFVGMAGAWISAK